MGSFLISCCATNQSISGEEVYVMPIFENNESVPNKDGLPLIGLRRVIYNTDLYGLSGFFFTGVYNDYGRYDINWDKVSNKYMLENYVAFLKENAVAIEQGSNEFHDVPFNPASIILTNNYEEVWEYIHEAIWEGRLFLKKRNYYNGIIYSKLNYFVAHKDNLDILLNMYRNREPSEIYFYNNDEEKEFYLKSTEDKARDLFDKVLQKEINKQKSDYDHVAAIMHEIHTDNAIYHFLGDASGTSERVSWRPNVLVKKKLVLDYKDDFDSYLEIYKSFVTMKDLIGSLSYCNVIIRPVYYASQDYSNDFGMRFSYWMSKIHERNVEAFEEYSESYDEDDTEEVRQQKLKNEIEARVKNFSW